MTTSKTILLGVGIVIAGTAAVGFSNSGALATKPAGVTPAGAPKTTQTHGIRWYDSLEDAKAVATKEKKPILLLSMFGKLDEKMPCANARTLRATLFKDPEFKKLMENDVVPAWEMVRAVPRVTIDLGNGEKISRTIRGNAVMYLCTSDGKVLDAYPGVYTAKDFLPMVKESMKMLSRDNTGAFAQQGSQPKDTLFASNGKGQTVQLGERPRSVDEAMVFFHRQRIGFARAGNMTFGKTAAEAPTLDLIGAKPTEGALVKVSDNVPRARRRFLEAAQGLRDLSLTPMTTEEAAIRVTGQGMQGQNPQDVAAQIIQIDSRNNIERVRPVVHLYFASLSKLPTPAEARDEILETILKIPYKDKYYGLRDIVMPGTED